MASRERDEDAAARWAVRLDAGPLAASDQTEFDEWLADDERRQGALLRAQATLAYLDRGRALADAAPGRERAHQWGGRAYARAGAIAAGIVLVLTAVSIGRSGPVEIATAVGEIRRVPLADGSVASVNTDSDVEVRINGNRRDITLRSGEAWFQVAHDKERPFVVSAGDVRVRAVGTAFSVRRNDRDVEVLVTEGVVDVWSVETGTPPLRVTAGNRGVMPTVRDATPTVRASGALERSLAWRTGELALDGETLDYAAGELNRYNRRKIIIESAALGREPLVGYFRVDQPEGFARAIGATMGANVRIQGDTIRLSDAR
jgi:transmembrane sensor